MSDKDTDLLWSAVKKRLEFADMCDTLCAFSKAPAEGILAFTRELVKVERLQPPIAWQA